MKLASRLVKLLFSCSLQCVLELGAISQRYTVSVLYDALLILVMEYKTKA